MCPPTNQINVDDLIRLMTKWLSQPKDTPEWYEAKLAWENAEAQFDRQEQANAELTI